MADAQQHHHRLVVHRRLGALQLQADLPLTAPWTLLFGPSGSGKSSLLRAACGLLGKEGVQFSRRDSSGSERTLIGPSRRTPTHELKLGYAPQQGALFPHLTVEENIAFAASVAREGDRPSSIDSLLDIFEIGALRTRMPRLLSGGERQRVNLARAFAVPNCRLLLLDEPFAGLDREMRDRLLPRMLTWARDGNVPVLSVSHDVDEALLVSADVYVLAEGKVVRHGPASEALDGERARLLSALR